MLRNHRLPAVSRESVVKEGGLSKARGANAGDGVMHLTMLSFDFCLNNLHATLRGGGYECRFKGVNCGCAL